MRTHNDKKDMNKLIQRLIFWPLALLPLAACQNDLPELPAAGPAPEEETITVPVNISVGGGTPVVRDLPPGMETGLLSGTCVVDRVRLIIFSREESLESEDVKPFIYHAEENQTVNELGQTSNEIVLEWDWNSSEATGEDGEHKFHYTLTKKKGRQYKIIALGYNEAYGAVSNFYAVGRNEKTLFNLNLQDGVTTPQSLALTLDTEHQQGEDFFNKLGKSDMERPFGTLEGNASANTTPYYYLGMNENHAFLNQRNDKHNDPLSMVAAPAPEIFYGICTNEYGENIISYNDINEVTGDLYRGVAKVTVEIENDIKDIYKRFWVALLANNVNTHTMLSSYDDFHNADEPAQPSPDAENGTGVWHLLGIDNCAENGTANITVYMLPTITELAVRVCWATDGSENYAYHYNYHLYTNAYSEADNATGIITSVTDGEQFYFRRNKSYKITGTLSAIEDADEL